MDNNAFTIWRETVSGVVSLWQAVIVWVTRSTRDGSGMLACDALAVEARLGPGEGGGDGNECADPSDCSAKKE